MALGAAGGRLSINDVQRFAAQTAATVNDLKGEINEVGDCAMDAYVLARVTEDAVGDTDGYTKTLRWMINQNVRAIASLKLAVSDIQVVLRALCAEKGLDYDAVSSLVHSSPCHTLT